MNCKRLWSGSLTMWSELPAETGFEIDDLIDMELSELREAYERDLFEVHAPEGGHIG